MGARATCSVSKIHSRANQVVPDVIDPPGRWVARYILAAILGAAGGVCGLYRAFDEIGYPGCLYSGVPIGAIAGCAFGWFAGTAVDRRRNLRRLRISIGELLIAAPAIAFGLAVLFGRGQVFPPVDPILFTVVGAAVLVALAQGVAVAILN
ncbi:MAG: hypothetical protein K1X74_04240 [Pirellulales bacterium]|nr:hypothetical protein [Pirellulales bacterium]